MADVKLKVVRNRSTGDYKTCRRMITGPGVNEHPPYPGCTGFVGWEAITCLSSGELLCSFSAGYWHVSFPQPIDLKPDLRESYSKAGFRSNIYAPTGGRALLSRSGDMGLTWSQPTTLVDTPGDDRHPVIREMPDGSLLCCFFVIDNWYGYQAPPPGRNKNSRVAAIRSVDNGKTWSEPVFMPSPFKFYDRMCSDTVLMPDGEVLLPTYGMDEWPKPTELGLYGSKDCGRTWRFISRLKSPLKEIDEPAVCLADDGNLVLITRPLGEVAFSSDRGKTWTKPEPVFQKIPEYNMTVIAPCLLKTKDGLIACVFGSPWPGQGKRVGINIIWSEDCGRTWTAPSPEHGFIVDPSVYLYGNGCELPDGSIYIVYYDGMGDQSRTAVWGIRVKIRADRKGIDILPAPGSPADSGITADNIMRSRETLDVDNIPPKQTHR